MNIAKCGTAFMLHLCENLYKWIYNKIYSQNKPSNINTCVLVTLLGSNSY